MKPTENIEKIIKGLHDTTTADMDNRVIGDILRTFKNQQMQTSAASQPNLWRIIMKNKITKLAAAAVIIIAVFVSINHFGGNLGVTSVTWADVSKKMDTASTVVFSITSDISYKGKEKLTMSAKAQAYTARDYGTRVDYFMNGELAWQRYKLPVKNIAYVIHPKEKQYQRITLSEKESGMGQDSDDPRQWVKKLLSGTYTKLGKSNINSIEVDGIETKDPNITGSEDLCMRTWADIKTGWPVRIEVEGPKMEGPNKAYVKHVMDDFEWNVKLDPNIFEPNIPSDYIQIENSQKSQLNQTSQIESDKGKEKEQVKEVAKTFFQTCAKEDWEKLREVLHTGVPINEQLKKHMGGLELIFLGEPFTKSGERGWLIH